MVSKSKGKVSSYEVFMLFVRENDAVGILTKECFKKWVETRKSQLKQPEESFRRVLTAHVCGLIGRKPFSADVEASLLRCLRRKQVWPCFKDTKVTIGIKGFRKAGFHENRRGIFGPNASSSRLSPIQTTSMTSVTLNSHLLAATSTRKQRRSSLLSEPTLEQTRDLSGYPIAENLVDMSFIGAKRALDNLAVESMFTVKRIRQTQDNILYPPSFYFNPAVYQDNNVTVVMPPTSTSTNGNYPLA